MGRLERFRNRRSSGIFTHNRFSSKRSMSIPVTCVIVCNAATWLADCVQVFLLTLEKPRPIYHDINDLPSGWIDDANPVFEWILFHCVLRTGPCLTLWDARDAAPTGSFHSWNKDSEESPHLCNVLIHDNTFIDLIFINQQVDQILLQSRN